MKHDFFLAATEVESGLTSISLGLFRALDKQGIRVGFCKPISQERFALGEKDPSISLVEQTTGFPVAEPLTLDLAERLLREDRMDDLMESVVDKVGAREDEVDVMVVEGLLPTESQSFLGRINRAMAKALNAQVILVKAMADGSVSALEESLETAASLYGGTRHANVIGCILNKVQKFAETSDDFEVRIGGLGQDNRPRDVISREELVRFEQEILEACPLFSSGNFSLIGCVPWNPHLPSFRMCDVARYLDAVPVSEGEMNTRRVQSIALTARNLSQILHVFEAGKLIIAPIDRIDVLVAASMATLDTVPLAGVILTGAGDADSKELERVKKFCHSAFEAGLPVFSVKTDSFYTATALSRMRNYIPGDDIARFNETLDYVSRHLDMLGLKARLEVELERRISPAAFRHQLAKRARLANKRIVLPEGNEPRTIVAALICHQREIARCVLLGDPKEIERVAASQGVSIEGIDVIDPLQVAENYVEDLIEMRRHKNLTEKQAREALEDSVYLGTMMLAKGEVDGLVSGAVHSSASTIRPALQLIKTRPGAKVVSSVFFMCLPDQVLVYGDCAVNPDPDAEALADIAVQSAESAIQFGITPKVALISYSTGQSGSGVDVDKVREATAIAQAARPELLIDGPLQYDAAAVRDVAAKKAPNSPVAGDATVFIFPDLNTGNTTYKAVQRAANVVSIGPMLQGLRKPVNDLSRGALVDDIVYTIAITAIQASF